jgi:hypothetical protein
MASSRSPSGRAHRSTARRRHRRPRRRPCGWRHSGEQHSAAQDRLRALVVPHKASTRGKAAGETQHTRNTAGVVTLGRNAAWTVQARHTIACRTARSSALSVLLWSTKAGEVGQPHRRKRKHLRSDSLRESVVPRTARSQSAPRPKARPRASGVALQIVRSRPSPRAECV